MNREETQNQSFLISEQDLLAFVRTMIGGRIEHEDAEHRLPSGPWDRVIRLALERIAVYGYPVPWKVVGPRPEPWVNTPISEVLSGGHSHRGGVELNPQPLPPRFVFLVSLAQTVISRAELIQEIVDATRREDEPRSNIRVSEYLARFVDDCLLGQLKWPFPGPPPPPPLFANELGGFDLLVMATQFEQAGTEAFNSDFSKTLRGASTKFAEAGLSRMHQSPAVQQKK